MTPLRVLVTGGAGQLGQALRKAMPSGLEARFTTRNELDIGNVDDVRDYIASYAPELIINAAAYTAVDKAETDAPAALRANSDAPRYLAEAASQRKHVRLIQVSTDFVFDGTASVPYTPDRPLNPLGVYGRSKAGGESAVLSILQDRAVVLRTAWVYSAVGHNFVRTMLRLLKERRQVSVVDDQIGTPTCTSSLAAVLWRFAIRPDLSGAFHWTDAGTASWYDFAVAIAEEGIATGLLTDDVVVKPIPTTGYPTPAQRPAYSVLDKHSTMQRLEIEPLHWRKQLRIVMRELAGA